jgi:DsbC/DsbD-like thiol-disulfide interchange protein
MNCPPSLVFRSILKTIFVLVAMCSSAAPQAFALTSSWAEAPKTKARLISGGAEPANGGSRVIFVDIELEPGWKTYWRTPGDAGGLPPSFDWSKSANLASANVMFPAPERMTDKSGNTIGYHDGVVLPVALVPENPDKPISVVVGLHYGICKDVCIPVEVELDLEVAPDEADALPQEALQALDRVPRAQDKLRPEDPVLNVATATLEGAVPKIRIEARFPVGADTANAFLEAPDGLFLPLPERVGEGGADGLVVFEAGLSADVDLAALKGKPVTVTLVSATGASFATFVAE